jgi:hypothetical protein
MTSDQCAKAREIVKRGANRLRLLAEYLGGTSGGDRGKVALEHARELEDVARMLQHAAKRGKSS